MLQRLMDKKNAVKYETGLKSGHFVEQFRRTFSGWSLYLRQPVLPASMAYILLGFNAVLSPGGLMTAFLASRGLTGTSAALFRQGLTFLALRIPS